MTEANCVCDVCHLSLLTCLGHGEPRVSCCCLPHNSVRSKKWKFAFSISESFQLPASHATLKINYSIWCACPPSPGHLEQLACKQSQELGRKMGLSEQCLAGEGTSKHQSLGFCSASSRCCERLQKERRQASSPASITFSCCVTNFSAASFARLAINDRRPMCSTPSTMSVSQMICGPVFISAGHN